MATHQFREKTQIQRGRNRAVDDFDVAVDIIDDSLLCHVGQKRGDSVVVTPTCHWRDGDRLYWHGHAKAFNVIGAKTAEVCINISQLDGLVLAKSAFHHSVNYRSVTVFGQPTIVQCDAEKKQQLEKFIEKISPGRWPQLRPVTEKELMVTSVAWIPLDELSVKVRAEGANDDPSDLHWPAWAGVMPLEKQFLQAKSQTPERSDTPALPDAFKNPIYGR